MGFVFDSEGTKPQQVSLPPIELQPPSSPWMIAQAAVEPTTTTMMAMPKGKIKEATGNSGNNHTRSLASALSAFDMHALSLGTLSPAFSPVPSSPLSVSVLAPLRTPQPMSPLTLSSSFFFFTPTGSPFPPASPNKLAVGVAGHPPGKQSVSLGMAPVAGMDGKRCGWERH